MLLYYSSLAFAIILLFAYHWHVPWLHHAFLLLLCTSLIHHSKYCYEFPGKKLVCWLDRILAHGLFFVMTWVVWQKNIWNVWVLIYALCASGSICIYYFYGTCGKTDRVSDALHSVMHFLVTIGTIAYMYGVYVLENVA